MNAASVSIVTRTKDRPLLLKRALASVLAQTHGDWTHIVVNDGGDQDAFSRAADEFLPHYRDRLKIVRNEKSAGVTAALNIGVKAAEGDLVVVHDDDDSWEPDFLTASIAALQDAKRVVSKVRGVVTHATLINERLENDRVVENYRYSFNGWLKVVSLMRLAGGNFIPPVSFLFERGVFSEIGYFDEAFPFAEDWEFYLRFLSRYEIAVLPRPLANYHVRSTASGSYGNTVTAGIDGHRMAGNFIRNELIRRNFGSPGLGIGHLIAQAGVSPLPGNLRHKIWNLQKQIFPRVQAKFRGLTGSQR
jgi:glycosyltransferase involved in cell wall biosynthesis